MAAMRSVANDLLEDSTVTHLRKGKKLAKNSRKTPDRGSGGMGKYLFNRPIGLIKECPGLICSDKV